MDCQHIRKKTQKFLKSEFESKTHTIESDKNCAINHIWILPAIELCVVTMNQNYSWIYSGKFVGNLKKYTRYSTSSLFFEYLLFTR